MTTKVTSSSPWLTLVDSSQGSNLFPKADLEARNEAVASWWKPNTKGKARNCEALIDRTAGIPGCLTPAKAEGIQEAAQWTGRWREARRFVGKRRQRRKRRKLTF